MIEDFGMERLAFTRHEPNFHWRDRCRREPGRRRSKYTMPGRPRRPTSTPSPGLMDKTGELLRIVGEFIA